MPKLLHSILLLVIIGVMIWTSTLWRWQINAASPSLWDVIVYLAIAPLCLTAILVLLIWQGKKIRQYLEAPTGDPPSHTCSSPAVAADESAAQTD